MQNDCPFVQICPTTYLQNISAILFIVLLLSKTNFRQFWSTNSHLNALSCFDPDTKKGKARERQLFLSREFTFKERGIVPEANYIPDIWKKEIKGMKKSG